MRYGSDKSGSSGGGDNFWGGAAAGAAVGTGGYVLVQKVKSANAKANWALGIGVVLTALAVVSSSDLNSDQTTAQNIATQYQALALNTATTATPTTIQAEIAALRSLGIQQANLAAKMCYDANWFAFSGTPVQQNAPVQNGAITATTTTTASNNNGLIIVAIAAVVVLLAVVL